ncbi:MAG: trigger factor [Bacteroidaceae bacterium]|nr:trigger factor [Bacteroidaceae bacterium]MBQ9175601.1 trigger factor [Bacteroidaceae bacterium]
MNITLDKIDAVNAVVTAEITPEDYQEKVKKAIKDFRKNANMPGFRKGMVPEGLIKKQYGLSILAEEVNKVLQESLYNYIRDNKVNMLGEPLSSEENNNIELVDGGTFTFKFDLALAPEMKVELTKKDKVEYYNVEVTDEMIDQQVDMYRQRGGNYKPVDDYQDNDMLKGVMTELDVEEPVTAEGVVMLPKYMKNDDQKKLFEGAKVNDVIRFNPTTAYDGNETELASLMKLDKEKVGEHKGDFNFQITEITRFVPGDLNEELFQQVFPGSDIKTEADFRQKVREGIESRYQKDSDFRFLIDVRNYLTKKIGKLEFPDEKLKKIMLNNAKGDEQKVEENYDKSIEELTWHLIKEQLVEQTGVKVDDKDVTEMAKDVTRMQFAQYGMMNIPDEYLDGSVKEMLKKRETVDNLIDRCIEVKLGTALKDIVTLKEKKVTPAEFNKLFEE